MLTQTEICLDQLIGFQTEFWMSQCNEIQRNSKYNNNNNEIPKGKQFQQHAYEHTHTHKQIMELFAV